MELIPISLDRNGETELIITWNDESQSRLSVERLRKSCPCATCREKKSSDSQPVKTNLLPVLSLAEARPVTIDGMRPVGNYAYNIAFSDGHDSGIFTFDFLKSLG